MYRSLTMLRERYDKKKQPRLIAAGRSQKKIKKQSSEQPVHIEEPCSPADGISALLRQAGGMRSLLRFKNISWDIRTGWSFQNFMGEKMLKIFDGKKTAKLGTEKNPAVVHVKTEKRMNEVAKIFKKNGWKYTIELNPDKPEDITDLEILLNRPEPKEAGEKVGRNEPCPCGSGKKYKKCCGK